jgi:L-ectoine synthase
LNTGGTKALIYHAAESLKGTKRYVQADGFVSIRLALAEDNLGFTVTEATGKTELDLEIQHKNHIEAVYVLEGTGEVELVETGEVYKLYPGVLIQIGYRSPRHRHLQSAADR